MVDHYQTIRLQRVEEPKIRLRVLPRIPPLEIELQNTGTMVQWRVGTTGAWQDLIPISDLDADISIGTVTTLPAGSSATVVNSGTAQDAVLDFGIPRGQDGLIASIVAGTNITVDDTDPANPIVSAVSSAGVDSVNGATGVVVLDAGDIGVTPAGNIAATDVQAAIEELDAEKQPLDADLSALATAFARATNTNPASIALAEDTDNGTNKITVTAPASVSSDKVLTLPDATDTLVGKATTDTLTNKTFNANGTGNSLSNVEVADFAASAIVTAAEGLASSDNDTSLPTTAAVIDAIAAGAGLTTDTQQPTTDVTTVTSTGFSGCKVVTASFAFTHNSASSATYTLQARVSGGTFRTICTFASLADATSSIGGSVTISNFNDPTEKLVSFQNFTSAVVLDDSSATNAVSIAGSSGVAFVAFNEVWDEIGITSSVANSIEGTTADQRGRWYVTGQ